jgi:hypothetical protein
MKSACSDPRKAALAKRARIAFGVYLLALIIPLPMPGLPIMGWYAFYAGLRVVISLISGLPGGTSARELLACIVVGLAWLGNPLTLAGMIALGRGANVKAIVLGAAAIGFALLASPFVLFVPLILLSYLIWLLAMGLVVNGALRPVRAPDFDPVGPGFLKLEDELP